MLVIESFLIGDDIRMSNGCQEAYFIDGMMYLIF